MQNFADAAFGKVPQAIEVTKQSETVITVQLTLGDAQHTDDNVIDAVSNPQLSAGEDAAL